MMPRMFAPRPAATGRRISGSITWTGILANAFSWSGKFVAKDSGGTTLQTWDAVSVSFSGGAGPYALTVPFATTTVSLIFVGKTLRTRVTLPAGTDPATADFTMYAGDVYPDGVGDDYINIADKIRIQLKIGQVYGPYDINGNPDEPIDAADLAIVTANYGRRSDPE